MDRIQLPLWSNFFFFFQVDRTLIFFFFKLDRMASAVNFHLAENSASNIIRRGALQFTKKNKTIQTPACLTYSLRGSVPHLVADNLKLLPIELVQISLEQL